MKIRISTNLLLIMIVALVMVVCTTLPASAAAKVPAKVAGVKVTKATNTAISISWKKARNAKLYQVNYKKASAKKWIALKKTKALKITKSGLKANTKYNFKVRGVNGKKYGKFSKVITQTTYATPGKVNVKTIFAKKRTRNSVELQWSKAANANKYEIQPYRLSGGALVSDESTGTSCKLGYLPTPNTWYGFKIRSVNTRTGRFPYIKSAWSPMFYSCTTFGNRVINGVPDNNGMIVYTMTGTAPFRIGEDDGLIPQGYYVHSDESDRYCETDLLLCDAVTFPDDFEDSEVRGQTFRIGQTFDGMEIQLICIGPVTDADQPHPLSGENVVTIAANNGIYLIKECEWR